LPLGASLSIGGGFNNTVEALGLQEDGKILVGGRFTQYGGDRRFSVLSLWIDLGMLPRATARVEATKPVDLLNTVGIMRRTNQPMARLVALSEGFTGLAHELKVDKTTIGRLEDNLFPITEPSVSSHHCEVVRQGDSFVVRDLNSTNGTYLNGEQITEATLKPGQILRLGQLELRFESGAAAAPASGKKPLDKTMVIPQGVKVQELDQGTRPVVGASSAFSKKSNRINVIFIGIGVALAVIIIALLLVALRTMS
jgi:hypothetical protein